MKKMILAASLAFMAVAASAQGRHLTLEECKELSYANNITLKNSHLDYLSAKTRKDEVFTNWFPVISARAAGFKAVNPLVQIGLTDVLGTSDMAYNIKNYVETEAAMYGVNSEYKTLGYGYTATVNLTQPVYAGGRIVNGNKLASLGVKASEIQENISRRDIASSIEEKYRLVVSLQEKKQSLDKAVSLADRLIGELEEAVSNGIMNDDQLSEIQLKRQELKSSEVRLKGSIMLARMDLCNAVGLDCSDALNLDLDDSSISFKDPEAYYLDPAEAVSNMDEVQLLQLQVEQKTLEKSMAVGEALPEIGIGAACGYGKVIGSARPNGAVYATVNIPLTDWKRASSKIQGSQYQIQKAQNNLDWNRKMLELQLRQLWVDVESRWEEVALREESLTHALRRENRAKDDYDAGLITCSEYMQKQVERSNAECNLIDARDAYCNAVSAFRSRCRSCVE